LVFGTRRQAMIDDKTTVIDATEVAPSLLRMLDRGLDEYNSLQSIRIPLNLTTDIELPGTFARADDQQLHIHLTQTVRVRTILQAKFRN